MLVQVIYNENKRCGAVHSSRLDFLIRSGLLFAFRRGFEWVVVDDDPVRGDGGKYEGPERRKNDLARIVSDLKLDNDELRFMSEVAIDDSFDSECCAWRK